MYIRYVRLYQKLVNNTIDIKDELSGLINGIVEQFIEHLSGADIFSDYYYLSQMISLMEDADCKFAVLPEDFKTECLFYKLNKMHRRDFIKRDNKGLPHA